MTTSLKLKATLDANDLTLRNDDSGNLEIVKDATVIATVSSAGQLSTKLVSATAQASTSGTSIEFSAIPSWAKRITVALAGVSFTGAIQLTLEIGAGSYTGSGYVGGFISLSSGPSITVGTSSTALAQLSPSSFGAAASLYTGNITLVNVSGNLWTYLSDIVRNDGISARASGHNTLSGALDRLKVGGGTFDAGTINILYE